MVLFVLNLQTFTVSHLMTHAGRGVYPYLPMATNAQWSIWSFFWGGGMKKIYLSMCFGLPNIGLLK